MNVNVAAPIVPTHLGIAGDPGSIDRSQNDSTKTGQQTEQRSQDLALAAAAVATRPQGSDPALWDTLTGAEQDYFATLESIGTLSYGPGETPAARVAPLGQRLDVRG